MLAEIHKKLRELKRSKPNILELNFVYNYV